MLAGLMMWSIAATCALLTGVLLIAEQRGVRTTLRLSVKGDVKREAAFLSQYGQSVATPLAAWLAAIAHGGDWRIFVLVCTPVMLASLLSGLAKRCLGRIRPNREGAGRFTGFSLRHESSRESFPSSHSACAFALSVALAHVWPEAAIVFWILAAITASLRYLTDAHFPSDVLAGAVLGLCVGHAGVWSVNGLLFPAR